MKYATWYRAVYNGYEPDNQIKMWGELAPDGKTYVVFEIWALLNFNDGQSVISIHKKKDGDFYWRKGDETGITTSFMTAWDKMPAYVTNPDDWEESPMTYYDQHP